MLTLWSTTLWSGQFIQVQKRRGNATLSMTTWSRTMDAYLQEYDFGYLLLNLR